jgi:hypothetical protein
MIPQAIRKRFAGPQGWTKHVPLQYLTDAFCSRENSALAKDLDDLYSIDGARGVISESKELPVGPELLLDFGQWFQAWGRFMELIETYVPQEAALWRVHYERIRDKPNKGDTWPVCVAYDSEVRRRSCNHGIDPSIFHLEIWNDLEAKHMGRVAVQTAREELSSYATKLSSSNSNSRYQPYPDSPDARSRSRSGNSFRASPNPNRLQITGPPGAEFQFRCFVCASLDRDHHSRSCKATKLVNGSDAILISLRPGQPRTDRNGTSFCFGYNGRNGCGDGPTCGRGKHWCSLCGSKNGSHGAQRCPAV